MSTFFRLNCEQSRCLGAVFPTKYIRNLATALGAQCFGLESPGDIYLEAPSSPTERSRMEQLLGEGRMAWAHVSDVPAGVRTTPRQGAVIGASFVYCGPERGNCRQGNPQAWRIQQAQLGMAVDEPVEGPALSGSAASSEVA